VITYISYLTNLYGHENNNNNNNNEKETNKQKTKTKQTKSSKQTTKNIKKQIKNKNKTNKNKTNKQNPTNKQQQQKTKMNDETAGKQGLITNSPIKQNRCSTEQFRYKPLFVVSEEKRRKRSQDCKRTVSDLTPWLNRNFSFLQKYVTAIRKIVHGAQL